MFPLALMPAPVLAAIKLLPFPYELYFPIAIFMGKVRGTEIWQGLAIQSCWVILSWWGTTMLWRSGLRRYQAVGG
jgi:ABC-2 type transport system permease protein